MGDESFEKEERLKSRKAIEKLFSEGHSYSVFPLRLVWTPIGERNGGPPVQFTCTVSKKVFKKAVSRNRIRRLMRESYRLNKKYLYQQLSESSNQFAFMAIYVAREELPFHEIEASMRRVLSMFSFQLKKKLDQ